MSDEQLMAECLTLFGAGHETTATALTWAWYLLCRHPEIYQRVQEEVDGVLQGRTPTYADLAKLPYCLQVFKETMRLYPPAYISSRRALRDVEIDGYSVPKDGVVLFSAYTLHRREDNFPQPERFDQLGKVVGGQDLRLLENGPVDGGKAPACGVGACLR